MKPSRDRADGLAIAVDLGATNLRAGLITRRGQVVERIHEATVSSCTEDLLTQLAAVIKSMRELGGEAVCVAVPGQVSRDGVVGDEVNIPLAGVDLARYLGELTETDVVVERDANAAVVGEATYGAAQGQQNVIMLTLGTGVGGGALVDGVLLRGADGGAGEFGHFVVETPGRPCLGTCAGAGHLEAYACGPAIEQQALEIAHHLPDGDLGTRLRERGSIDSEAVVELASSGAADARDLLDEVGRHLGTCMEALVNLFNPTTIAVSGSVATAGDLILGSARRRIAETALRPGKSTVSVLQASLGGDAGLLGAGAIAHQVHA